MTDRELVDLVDRVVQQALCAAETDSPEDVEICVQRAREDLREVAFGVRAGQQAPLRQALACAQAACEHLEFGELLEARTLLTAARRQLALVRSGQPQGVS